MIYFGARAHDYGKDIPATLFKKIKEDGFSGIQLAFKKAILGIDKWQDITPYIIAEVKLVLDTQKLVVPVLGTYVELALADEEKRLAAVKEFSAGISFAKDLGAYCVGTETTSPEKQPGVTSSEALYALTKSLSELLPKAEEYGVIIALEPAEGDTLNTPEKVKQLLGDLRSNNLKIIFDAVNMLPASYVNSQKQLWERCFSCFSDDIIAAHIKGTKIIDGKKEASTLADSVIDYKTLFEYYKNINRDLFVLREQFEPQYVAEDLKYLLSLAK